MIGILVLLLAAIGAGASIFLYFGHYWYLLLKKKP